MVAFKPSWTVTTGKAPKDKVESFHQTSEWQKLSRRKRQDQPLCEVCLADGGRVTAAQLVHHLQSIRERWDLRLTYSNLQSQCQACHNRITAEEVSRKSN